MTEDHAELAASAVYDGGDRQPEELRVDRPAPHLSFGPSILTWFGSLRARMELRAPLERSLRRPPDLRIVTTNIGYVFGGGGGDAFTGSLRVAFTPAEPRSAAA